MFTLKFDRRVRLLVAVLIASAALGGALGTWALWPGNADVGRTGPVQPIPYSHRVHVGQLEMDCLYCHAGIEDAAHATVPPVSTCMKCHAQIKPRYQEGPRKGQLKNGISKLFWEGKDDPDGGFVDLETHEILKPIAWEKVHDLADFAYFHHGRHVASGIDCAACHGDVASMEVIRQVKPLSMSWCIDCHQNGPGRGDRTNKYLKLANQPLPELELPAPMNCGACHR